MCIRDSDSSASFTSPLGGSYTVTRDVAAMAVSYTHLDVYKRQVRGRAMGLSTTQAFGDIVTGIGRMSPLILDNLGICLLYTSRCV